jgi:hypothetical protein
VTRTLLRNDVIGDEAEALFRRRVIKFAKLRGWLVFYTADSVGSAPGEFDLRLYRPPRVIHAELKSEHGHLSQDQKRVRVIYEACPGLETCVWKPSAWLDIEQVLM